jgi:hypothetical protein
VQNHIRKAGKEIASGEMYATFDRHSPASLGADVLSLSWKGDAGRGWLAAGNSRKTVGVTYTEAKDWAEEDGDSTELATPAPEVLLERQGMRRNFNFREHSAEVGEIFRRWPCLCAKKELFC